LKEKDENNEIRDIEKLDGQVATETQHLAGTV